MGYLIPEIINPPERICVMLRIPNDPEHLQVFWGHLSMLGKWYEWERDELHRGKDVAAVYNEVWQQARESAAVGECMSVFDLKQVGVTIERQVSCDSVWTLLYDPSPYVILKVPSATYQNFIVAPAGIRGLWIRQAGGEIALAVSQQGATGRGVLVALESGLNTDEVLGLERAQSNGDYLKVRVNGLWQTTINRYGQINSIIYTANLPGADSHTVGAIIYLSGSANPSTFPDGAYIGSFEIVGATPVYYWAKFKGDTGATGGVGPPGATGPVGHGISFASPPSAPVATNVAPSLSVDNTNPAVTVVQANLPIAQKTNWLDPILIPYGNPISLDTAINGSGDIDAQLYMPAGQPGSGGGTSKNTTPPAPGTIVEYVDSIQAEGTLIPFPLVNGDLITVPSAAQGLWAIYSTVGIKDYVSAWDGITVGAFNDVGKLVLETLAPTDNIWQEQDYLPGVTIAADNTYGRWKQKEVIPSVRSGELQLKYEIYRPVVLRYDWFRLALMGLNPDIYYRCNELTGTVLTDEFGRQMSIVGGGFTLNQPGGYSGDNHRAIHWTGAYAAETTSIPITGDHSYSIVCVAKQSGRAIFAAMSPNSDTGGTRMQSVGYYDGQVGFFGRGSPSTEILTGSLPDTNFHVFTFTYDSVAHERKVWRDDDLIADGAYTWLGGDSSLFWRIGTDVFAGSNWTGCEVALYDFKIDSADVAFNYDAYLKSQAGAP